MSEACAILVIYGENAIRYFCSWGKRCRFWNVL